MNDADRRFYEILSDVPPGTWVSMSFVGGEIKGVVKELTEDYVVMYDDFPFERRVTIRMSAITGVWR